MSQASDDELPEPEVTTFSEEGPWVNSMGLSSTWTATFEGDNQENEDQEEYGSNGVEPPADLPWEPRNRRTTPAIACAYKPRRQQHRLPKHYKLRARLPKSSACAALRPKEIRRPAPARTASQMPPAHDARYEPLKWLMANNHLTGAHARWACILQEHDFTIMHRPGAQSANVDALSRFPRASTEDRSGARFDEDTEAEVTRIVAALTSRSIFESEWLHPIQTYGNADM